MDGGGGRPLELNEEYIDKIAWMFNHRDCLDGGGGRPLELSEEDIDKIAYNDISERLPEDFLKPTDPQQFGFQSSLADFPSVRF